MSPAAFRLTCGVLPDGLLDRLDSCGFQSLGTTNATDTSGRLAAARGKASGRFLDSGI
jgi:hypothetical protein